MEGSTCPQPHKIAAFKESVLSQKGEFYTPILHQKIKKSAKFKLMPFLTIPHTAELQHNIYIQLLFVANTFEKG